MRRRGRTWRSRQLTRMILNLLDVSRADTLQADVAPLHAALDEDLVRRMPTIALTAAASERDRHRGTSAGFFRYLTKPVDVDELVEAMDLVLAASAPSH